MERRKFLQNMFGAAVIAAIPKIVLDQIEAIAPQDITPAKKKEPKDITPAKKKEPTPTKGLYIYDKNQLIAASTLFTVNVTHHYIDTTSLDDLSYNGYRSFIPVQYDCKIYAEKLRWFNGLSGRNFIESNDPLKCLIYTDELRIEGKVLLTECTLTFDMMHELEEDVVLTIIGNIIINERTDS